MLPRATAWFRVDRNTDIFSFGIMLYEMASGMHPFKACGFDVDDRAHPGGRSSRIFPERILQCPAVCAHCSAMPEKETLGALCEYARSAGRAGETLRRPGEQPAVPAAGRLVVAVPPGLCGIWLLWDALPPVVGEGEIGRDRRISVVFSGARCCRNCGKPAAAPVVYLEILCFRTPEQRRRVAPWIRGADCLFVFVLAVCAIRNHTEHAIIATLLMAVAIGALVAFLMIEPVTARAALDKQ